MTPIRLVWRPAVVDNRALMSTASVLIVGAGAMGLVAGYHFQLASAKVTYLVRPGRVPVFAAPQLLYCYDDGALKRFDGYRTVERVADVARERFDYVMLTLDGATSRSEQGSAVLAELGVALRDTQTVMTVGGVGVGLREHVQATTGLPPQRLLNVALALLCHQVSAGLPVHPPVDPARIAKAAVAYRHFPNRASLLVDAGGGDAARAFAALYNRNGSSRCISAPRSLYAIMGNAAFPMLAASQIAGWPSIAGLVAQRELWALACAAQNEIAALPRFGWIGRALSLAMTPSLTARLHSKIERDCLPLDYQAFNRFHHGGKVHAQDVQVLQNCLAEGRNAGRRMTALATLLEQLAAHEAAA